MRVTSLLAKEGTSKALLGIEKKPYKMEDDEWNDIDFHVKATINSICFQIFRTIIPLSLLINSLPRHTEEEARKKRGETAKDSDLLSCFQEFRELRL